MATITNTLSVITNGTNIYLQHAVTNTTTITNTIAEAIGIGSRNDLVILLAIITIVIIVAIFDMYRRYRRSMREMYEREKYERFKNPISSSPLEKKYQEIDEEIVEWKKVVEEYDALPYHDNYDSDDDYYSEEEQDYINRYNSIRDEIYRRVETYKGHRGLIELAHTMAKIDGETDKINKYDKLLIETDKKELVDLQDENFIQKEQKKYLSYEYKIKSSTLKQLNKMFTLCFLSITGLFAIGLGVFFSLSSLPTEEELMAFLITKTTITITITMIIFWVAKFFNRRIHENVHLIEEYEHRALLLDTFDLLTASVNTEEHKKEILDKILIALIENPTKCLNKKKVDKSPTTEVIELIKALPNIKITP